MLRSICSYKIMALCVFAMVLGVLLFPAEASATFISPPRVIIDSNQVASEMVILNRSDETRVYNFQWLDRAMTADAKIAADDEIANIKDYRPASPFLVYSPRQVILGPGETQRIRFFVKRNKMTDGEYRSHILIRGEAADKKKPERVEGLGGSLGVVPQAGIPVMVRHGRTKVEIEPQVFELVKKDGRDYIHAKFINKSTRTLYAMPTLVCKRPGVEEPEKIEGLSVRMYHEAVYFDEMLRINKDEPDLEGCESIAIEFTDRLDFEYKTKPFYTQVLK